MSTVDKSLSSKDDRPADEVHIEKLSLNGEDEINANAAKSGTEDPAVLALGPPKPRLRYSREQLVHFRNSPLSRVQPELPPEILKTNGKRSESSDDQPPKEDSGNNKSGNGNNRRVADPRERVRRESESAGGIVLSPQRRSFVSGCGAPAPKGEEPPPPTENVREQRRIGSGRILSRELSVPWERGTNNSTNSNNHDDNIYRPPSQRNPEQYERRSYGRDSNNDNPRQNNREIIRDRDRDEPRAFDKESNHQRRSNNRYDHRHRNDEEPEWFSGGPTSQLETIELRGFDEPSSPLKDGKESTEKSSTSSENNWPSEQSPPLSPNKTHPSNANEATSMHQSEESIQQSQEQQPQQEETTHKSDFNFDDFMSCDTIPGLLTNGGSAEGSRFSRWFRSESPQGPEHIINNILEDIDREDQLPVITPTSRPPSLMEMLQRANAQTQPQPPNSIHPPPPVPVAQKIHSLEELEANMRGIRAQKPHQSDLNAFKRLLAQVSTPTPEMPKYQPQQEQPHVPHDLVYQLLQVQQNQQRQQAAAAASLGPNMVPGMAGPNMSMGPMRPDHAAAAAAARLRGGELLARPEAQAILHGLKVGEITVNHIVQQLSNPGLQARHRELLTAVLRLHDHHTSPTHHQAPLRLSPPPHAGVPGMPPRIPSPRELAAHTQSIMHGALIKKKLEEQRENYRRRAEMHKPQTPISFTPTSVLRKMTAEKDVVEGVRGWPQKQGRPIVKGNQGSGPTAYPAPIPPPAEFPPHHNYPTQHLPQPIPGRHYPAPPLQQWPQQMPTNSTLQHLILQSRHRNINEGGSGRLSPTSNQLARWFSPELLAQASAGKLPSLATKPPNAMSLEELERRALATHN